MGRKLASNFPKRRAVLYFVVALLSRPLDALVISEIHYNPIEGRQLEFIELTNDEPTPEDVSGWSFTEGVRYTFPPGTVVFGGDVLVVCADVESVRSTYGINNVVGNFDGRLDGSGERLTLVNHAGAVIQSLRYQTDGKWPVGPDGGGHSLILRSLHVDTSEPESWTQSPELGGSPGFVNDPEVRIQFDEEVLIEIGDEWRFRKGTSPFSDPENAWQLPEFDDSDWEIGPSGFGFSDDDDATVWDDMQGQYVSGVVRRTFELSEEQFGELDAVFLDINFDDGFCAFINGVEFARTNCPEEPLWNETARGFHEATSRGFELHEMQREDLRVGTNVLAIIGYNRRVNDGDFSLLPRVLHRRSIVPQLGPTRALFFNELYRGSEAEAGWIEIYNAESVARDLSGWSLAADPQQLERFVFGEGNAIPALGYLVVDANIANVALTANEPVQLFLFSPDGFVGAAATFDRLVPDGMAPELFSEARFPDGNGRSWLTPTRTPGATNDVPRVTDVVINEIHYHPPEERAGEFLELYNRGQAAIDLSGFRFTRGIDVTFAGGTVLAPGGYLVLAEDPRLLQQTYGVAGAIEYEGTLANGGENVRLVDTLGNLVDEVRYFDGGTWPLWADGRGSSLELIDPHQDNDFAAAWEASDETGKAPWEQHSFHVPRLGSSSETELQIMLAERGICHIDDVSITGDAFVESPLLPAGAEWRFRKGTGPFSDPANAWMMSEFDDSSWETAVAGFGYGDEGLGTILDDMQENYNTLAIRARFEMTQEQLSNERLEFYFGIYYDDGYCAFLNGELLDRRGCSRNPAWDDTARIGHEADEEITIRIPEERLRVGENVLAVLGVNRVARVAPGSPEFAADDDFTLHPRVFVLRPEGRSQNLLANPGFEEDTATWRFEGTHSRSRRVQDDANGGSACLEMIATGKGDMTCNRIETDTEPRLTADRRYDISLATRWVRGSSLLLVHGTFSPGEWPGTRDSNLSGNEIAQAIRMAIPDDLGTPGAENSVRRLLREFTENGNLGPLIADVEHEPINPTPGATVTVRARVVDSDGIGSVRILYREDIDSEEPLDFLSIEMSEVAGSRDPLTGVATYEGQIQPIETSQVIFFVEAEDAFGTQGTFPFDAPEKTLVYRYADPFPHRIEVLLPLAEWSELRTRRLHSNDLVDGTVTYAGEQIFYNVGVRYRGSPWGRGTLESIRVRFPDDRLYKGTRRDINISNRDRTDGAAYPVVGRSGNRDSPVPVADYKYVATRFNGRSFGTPGVFEPYDRTLLDKWYGRDVTRDAVLLKSIGRLLFSDGCSRTAWDEATMAHRNENAENYRFYWFHSIHQTRDNWQPFIDATRIADGRVTSDEDFDAEFESVIDVETFIRGLMPRILMSDGDGLFVGNGHNGYLFWDPSDGRWEYFPFDMGLGWGGTPTSLFSVRDRVVRRVLAHPRSQRTYYRVLNEYLNNYWSEERAGPFLDALQEQSNSVGTQQKAFIRASNPRLFRLIEPFVNAELRILTNQGEDFSVGTPTVTLSGEASTLMTLFTIRLNGGAPQAFVPVWTSALQWTTTLPMSGDSLMVQIDGFGVDGVALGSAGITIRRGPLREFIRGDVNDDNSLNISDAIEALLHLFRGFPIACPDAADFDDSGNVDLSDALGVLGYAFRDGDPPASPFPERGVDITDDPLECRSE